MKRCSVCGCIIENDSDDICEVCKDDLDESNPYKQWENDY